MASDFIVDISEADFEYEVLSYSQNVPVVVDFWASWCRPCRTLGPMLEKLAMEHQGGFRLAKVDVDANPNLAMRYGVRSIPAVLAFSQGELVSQFTGVQPEERVREFITRITPPGPLNLALEKARSLLADHDWEGAESIYRELIDASPQEPEFQLGLAMSLLGQGLVDEPLRILAGFPPSKQFATAAQLMPYARALQQLRSGTLPEETDADLTFANSVRLASRGNLPAAIDGLLDVLRQDKRYRGGAARDLILALLVLLGEEHPLAREYRGELASVLF